MKVTTYTEFKIVLESDTDEDIWLSCERVEDCAVSFDRGGEPILDVFDQSVLSGWLNGDAQPSDEE